MSSARVERALREGKRLPPENLLLVGCGFDGTPEKCETGHLDATRAQKVFYAIEPVSQAQDVYRALPIKLTSSIEAG
jgi:hypothetical protein